MIAASSTPTVSVVIATYNRSQVLRHAIRSVIQSSFTDWELIVVGDACTDDTADCVAAFDDPRIRFVNLPERCGDQSGPNNAGVALARGRYIAFLNHDDLHLPEHLGRCVADLDRGGADFVWTATLLMHPDPDSGRARPCRFRYAGVPVSRGYSPFAFYVASSWVFRRELAARVGPWPSPREAYVTPSQAWLFRASRAGAVLRFVPCAGVVMVGAGHRPGSYARRDSPDHEWLVRWIETEPRWREVMAEEAGLGAAMESLTHRYEARLQAIHRLLLWPAHAALAACGLHPRSLGLLVRLGGRGAEIREHARLTGARAGEH